MKIQLTVKTGTDHQITALVHEAEIPPFQVAPEVIIWGNRAFQRTSLGNAELVIYQECFAYVLIDLPPNMLDPEEAQQA